jgi:mannan endo-1,4-beta-mannosidase
MKKILLAVALVAGTVVHAATGFNISGAKLLDASGNQFQFRGINFPYAWSASELSTAIPAISATGANSVRLVLADGGQWTRTSASEVRNIINTVKANKMVAVLEIHDCTGWTESTAAKSLGTAVDYWLSSDIKAELVGQEAYVIIDIANEPFGNTTSAKTYVDSTKNAIARMRRGGLTHTLMVDGATWGQDQNNTMLDSGKSILAADTLSNTILSVHMYQVYNSQTAVDNYLKAANTAGLPLLVGEFADHSNNSTTVAAQSILQLCAKYGYGYMGWSWKGNSPVGGSTGLDSLDIAKQWDGSVLSAWGELLINDPAGIKATSQLSSVYSAADGKKLVLAYAQGEGTVTASSTGRVDTGKADTIKATAITGYDFIGWSGDTAGTKINGATLIIPKVTKDVTIQANFSPGSGANLIKDGDFSTSASWSFYAATGNTASASYSTGAAVVTIGSQDDTSYHIQLSQSGIQIDSGVTYVLTFDASASAARTLSVDFSTGANSDTSKAWKWVGGGSVSLTTTTTNFSMEVTALRSAPSGVVQLGLGGATPTVTIDNVTLVKKAAGTSVAPRSISSTTSWTIARSGSSIDWTRSEAIAKGGVVRLVGMDGRELSRAAVAAGTKSGSLKAPSTGIAFLVLETSEAREVKTLPLMR